MWRHDEGFSDGVLLWQADTGFDDDDYAISLDMLNLLIMPCTAAANCGVNSHELFTALRYGLALNIFPFSHKRVPAHLSAKEKHNSQEAAV